MKISQVLCSLKNDKRMLSAAILHDTLRVKAYDCCLICNMYCTTASVHDFS